MTTEIETIHEEEAQPRNALELVAHLIRHCRACPLGFTRNQAVPGDGPASAKIMIVAEGPGKNEDEQGLPFVGQAGKFLDELLEVAGLTRQNVYITNMIKCRAPENRDPKPEETGACGKHLERQINVLQPELIIALGKFSLARFLPGEGPIGKVRGTLRNRGGLFVYPVMHPAAGLRRTEYKDQITADFRNLPEVLRQIRENPPEPEPEAPPAKEKIGTTEQSSLF